MKKKIIVVGLLIIAVVAVVELKNKKNQCGPARCADGVCTFPIPGSEPLPEMAQDKPASEKPLPRLLDLGAGKCVPCKMMAPILDEMKETFTGQLDVEFVDVWETEGVGDQYGIRMIPTQIYFDADGKELFRHEGFFAREDMLAKWQELGFVFEEKQ